MKSILVIEDDRSVRESLTELLSHKKYNVISAKDGDEGMVLVKQGKPDLVICDVMMPGTDGHQVLKAIRDDKNVANTPFVFLTAKTMYDDIRGGMALGADDYLIKPFKAQHLFDTVEARLKRQNQIKKEFDAKLKIVKPLEETIIAKGLITPLEGIVEFSKMLMTHFDRYSKQEIQNFLRRINTSAFSLNKKIASIVLFQSLEKAKYDKKIYKQLAKGSCKLDVKFVKDIFIAVAKAHDREMDLFIQSIDAQKLEISEENMKYVLQELIDNAFKFSDKGDLVEIKGYAEGKKYQLEIVNKGRAITNEFSETESLIKLGAGLGLYVSSQILNLNRGLLRITRSGMSKNRVSIGIDI